MPSAKQRITDGTQLGKWIIYKTLSCKASGDVYQAKHHITGLSVIAKIQQINHWQHSLIFEANVLLQLNGLQGLPQLFDCFAAYHNNQLYHIIIVELLGENLEHLFQRCNYSFSPVTISNYMCQMILLLRNLHAHSFVHGMLTPKSFMLGIGENSNQLYIVDFGCSHSICEKPTQILNICEAVRSQSALDFQSINSILGLQLSFRDDVESTAYIFIYFIRQGMLPWKLNFKTKYSLQRNLIADAKLKLLNEIYNKQYTDTGSRLLAYASSLDINIIPDYNYLFFCLNRFIIARN